jgi:hypothetical protein
MAKNLQKPNVLFMQREHCRKVQVAEAEALRGSSWGRKYPNAGIPLPIKIEQWPF